MVVDICWWASSLRLDNKAAENSCLTGLISPRKPPRIVGIYRNISQGLARCEHSMHQSYQTYMNLFPLTFLEFVRRAFSSISSQQPVTYPNSYAREHFE
jgi:hypothetical protein